MALLATVYCTETDIDNRLGSTAKDTFADVNRTDVADQDTIDEAINRATLDIDLYLLEKYSATQLLSSNLVNRWATTLAIYYLMTAAGNSASGQIQAQWDYLMDPVIGIFTRIKNGDLQLPDTALRADMRPTMSNYTIDRRYRDRTVRRRPSSSTGPTSTLGHDDTWGVNGYWD